MFMKGSFNSMEINLPDMSPIMAGITSSHCNSCAGHTGSFPVFLFPWQLKLQFPHYIHIRGVKQKRAQMFDVYIKSIKVTHISFLPITVKEDKNERCLLFTGIFFNYLLELDFFFFNLGKRFEVFLLHHCTVNFHHIL